MSIQWKQCQSFWSIHRGCIKLMRNYLDGRYAVVYAPKYGREHIKTFANVNEATAQFHAYLSRLDN